MNGVGGISEVENPCNTNYSYILKANCTEIFLNSLKVTRNGSILLVLYLKLGGSIFHFGGYFSKNYSIFK